MSEQTQRSVIVELAPTATDMEAATRATTLSRAKSAVVLDTTFEPVQLPSMQPIDPSLKDSVDPTDTSPPFVLNLDPAASTYLVQATVDERRVDELAARNDVVGVFSNPRIESCVPVCPGGAARGTHVDVANALCIGDLASVGANGSGVLLAIVDSGISLAHLQSRGLNPTIDVARSWVPGPGFTPFQFAPDHGTMCAFDALIAAPRATLLDVALLAGQTSLQGVLADALPAYRHLIDVMNAPRRPGDNRSMVVSNSWGMFHPSWDFPVGHPGNYSHNPNHPFNRMVADLEVAGADILFAAGNCGAPCPDGRCQGLTTAGIFGANSSTSVLSVAGVDVFRERAGYSTQGPGCLTWQKPDLCGYTHFQGSGVYAADGGTSAATPVVAGVVAAVRTRRPYNPLLGTSRPAAIRTLLTSTADDLGTTGYDFDHGFGVVDGCELAQRLGPPLPIDLCRRFPFLCRKHRLCDLFPELCRPRFNICKTYPWICKGLEELDRLRIPDPGPLHHINELVEELERIKLGRVGFSGSSGDEDASSGRAKSGGCGCGGPG